MQLRGYASKAAGAAKQFRRNWKRVITKSADNGARLVGVCWLVDRIALSYAPQIHSTVFEGGLVIVATLMVGCILGAKASWPRSITQKRIAGTNIEIAIKIGDMFEEPGTFIVPASTTFETGIGEGRIAEDSIQGQLTRQFFRNEQELRRQIEEGRGQKAADGVNDTRVIRITSGKRAAYLVATATVNRHGLAHGSRESIGEGLGELWEHIGTREDMSELVAPAIGSDRHRIPQFTPETAARFLIRSFIAACSEKRFCRKLSVVLTDDQMDKGVDLERLGAWLAHECEYNSQETTGHRVKTRSTKRSKGINETG